MKVVWEEEARGDLLRIGQYVARDSVSAALALMQRIEDAAAGLADMPDRFRDGPVDGTRERIVAGTPYIIGYRVRESYVQIFSLFHAAQDKPRGG
jgi:toxin ParE1/3/4